MFRSYTHKDVLTRASITLQIIDDVALYNARIFSSNGSIFNINDSTSEISVVVQKGLEDITDRFTDIVWSRFHVNAGKYEEDLEWGKQHYGKKTFTLHRDDIVEKANIQVAIYDMINGEKKLVAADFLSFIDVNDLKGSETPPDNPKHGDLWLDTSTSPPKLMVWDDNLKQWIEVIVAGNERRNLLRNSNFYKKTFDFWTPIGDPTLEIESFAGKKWARISSATSPLKHRGITQKVKAVAKSIYSFQMVSNIYLQSQHPNGNALVSMYSINKDKEKTLIEEKTFDIKEEAANYNFSFTSFNDTTEIEVIISGIESEAFDFVVTNTKLEKYPIPTEWEIAIEDIQDALDNKVGNTAEEVFDSLTDGGKMQGIYVDIDEEGQKNYYISGRYIDAYNLQVRRKTDDVITFKINEQGEVDLRAKSLQIVGDSGDFENAATENDISWKIEILSSNGNIFKNSIINTTLSARVYKGKKDVTDEIPAEKFTWKRTSINKSNDLRWNDNEGVGVKEILITREDINQKATFTCEVSD